MTYDYGKVLGLIVRKMLKALLCNNLLFSTKFVFFDNKLHICHFVLLVASTDSPFWVFLKFDQDFLFFHF